MISFSSSLHSLETSSAVLLLGNTAPRQLHMSCRLEDHVPQAEQETPGTACSLRLASFTEAPSGSSLHLIIVFPVAPGKHALWHITSIDKDVYARQSKFAGLSFVPYCAKCCICWLHMRGLKGCLTFPNKGRVIL